jgi:hypothetical protein
MTGIAGHTVAVEDLLGVWRRGVLVTPDGRRDETSDVYWLQSLTMCGDIRRQTAAGDDAPFLTSFAGRLSERDGVFRWERTLASPPVQGPPDDGRLSWQGEVLREDGVHEPYWETWIRIAMPAPGDYAAELFDPVEGRRGYLLSIGGFAFFGVSTLPGGKAAAFAFRGSGARDSAIALSAGASGWWADLPSGTPGSVVHIAERDAQEGMVSRDWFVAALEHPFVLSARTNFS